MSLEKPTLLSTKLRQYAQQIDQLLEQYETFKFGNKEYRKWKNNPAQKEPPPNATPPSIYVFSSPTTLFDTQNQNLKDNPPTICNPALNALIELGEISPADANNLQIKNKIRILRDFGIGDEYDCRALLEWSRNLAQALTYILELKTVYSEEIKARYPELLTNLQTACSSAIELARVLSRQNGILTSSQYRMLIGNMLLYASIAKVSALQLADYHDEYIARTAPLVSEMREELTPEEEWFESEQPKEGGEK